MGRMWIAAALVLLVAACSDSGTADVEAMDVTVAVPGDATFCSVFTGEYREALSSAVPVTDPAFAERTAEIVAWAEVLAALAPDEITDEARDNLGYHRAQAAIASAAEYIPGSNAMHEWANANC
jgi:hypothetical protein